MTYLPEEQVSVLLAYAEEAATHTHSPYSAFPVGAAVLTKDGSIYKGTNVENASYGLTICAERNALTSAVVGGHEDIVAIAIHAPLPSISPCGACRQFIIEFGEDVIVIFRQEGNILQMPISELLPYGFTSKALKQ